MTAVLIVMALKLREVSGGDHVDGGEGDHDRGTGRADRAGRRHDGGDS
jgi:hypothetical protein